MHKDGGALAQRARVSPIGQQGPRLGIVPSVGYGWEPVPQREPQELLPVRSKEGGFHDQERVGTTMDHGGESRLEGDGSARLHTLELHTQRPRFPRDVAGTCA